MDGNNIVNSDIAKLRSLLEILESQQKTVRDVELLQSQFRAVLRDLEMITTHEQENIDGISKKRRGELVSIHDKNIYKAEDNLKKARTERGKNFEKCKKDRIVNETAELIEETKNKRSGNHDAEVDKVAALKAQQPPVTTGTVPQQSADGAKDTPGAETVDDKNKAQAEITTKKIDGETTTFTFNVRATKDENGIVTGYTGYNIVAGLYKNAEGKALTHSEIKAIAEEIFKGQALPKGDIHLPKEIEVGGKTYKIADDAKQEHVRTSTYTLAKTAKMFTSTAKKEDDHWVGFVDGNQIKGQFKTEAEAQKAAEEAAAKAQTETE